MRINLPAAVVVVAAAAAGGLTINFYENEFWKWKCYLQFRAEELL